MVRVEGYTSIIWGRNPKHIGKELLEKSRAIECACIDGRVFIGYNTEIIHLIDEVYLDEEISIVWY